MKFLKKLKRGELKGWALGALLGFVCIGLLSGIGFLVLILNLPKLGSLRDYSPALVSKVLAKDGRLMGEFSTERRYLLAIDQIPDTAINAFTSAEDDRFFEHPGIDFRGITRAFFVNLKAGRVVQGGSTITQQVAKSLLLSPERSFGRKIKEILLAYKIESNFSKKQILYLYMNQIYLGQGAYGLEAAAQTYFHKSAKEMTVAEAALLAGLVQAPSKYSPVRNPKRARERQQYVLRRMMETGHITEEQYKQSVAEEVRVYFEEDRNLKVAPYYVEHVRQRLMEKYGQEKVYTGGLVVETAADYDLSITAMNAVRANLKELDKRQGYRGPLGHLKNNEEILEELKKIRNDVLLKKFPFHIMPRDPNESLSDERWSEYTFKKMSEKEDFSNEKKLLIPGESYRAVVTRIEPDDKSAALLIGSIKAKLALKDMRWAKRIKPPELAGWANISRVSESLHQGDIIAVRPLPLTGMEKETDPAAVELDQEPIAQSALLSMEAATGQVIAMVGGYDFAKSEFNRALQGERQPGSAFKAFLYAAALDKGFTPASIIVDSPVIFESQGGANGLKWIPENNSEKFYGDTTLRTAIINSRNVPAVKILQEIQLPYFTNYLKALGVSGTISPDLSLALGSKTMSLSDITKLYALFPRLGMRIEPVFILKVTDHSGQVLEQYSYNDVQKEAAARWLKWKEENLPKEEAASEPAPTEEEMKKERPKGVPQFDDPLRAMDEKTAFVMGNLLQEVVQSGTGTGAKVLKRKVGGKTGTTSEFVDAWFLGFSPEVVTGVWTGFDNPRTLGPGEVGSRAALPAWISYMNAALSVYKQDEFTVPKGIVFVRMDPKTGALARPGNNNAVKEAFIEDTEPSPNRQNTVTPDSSDFFREDL